MAGQLSLQQLKYLIGQQESGGNYDAYNPNDPSGAYGKYQILGDNIPSWGARAGYNGLTIDQFKNSPEIQEAVVDRILGDYQREFGDRGASIAWNGGTGALKRMDDGSYTGAFQQVNDYADSVFGRSLPEDLGGGIGTQGSVQPSLTGGNSQIDILNKFMDRSQPNYSKMPDQSVINQFLQAGQNNNKQGNLDSARLMASMYGNMMGAGAFGRAPIELIEPYMRNSQNILNSAIPFTEEQINIQNNKEIMDQIPNMLNEYNNAQNPVAEQYLSSLINKRAGTNIAGNSGRYLTDKDILPLVLNANNSDRNFKLNMENSMLDREVKRERILADKEARMQNLEMRRLALENAGQKKIANSLKDFESNWFKIVSDDKLEDEPKQKMLQVLVSRAISDGALDQAQGAMYLSPLGTINDNFLGEEGRDFINLLNNSQTFVPKQ